MNYVLITPAKDEAATIAKTIRSVISQTLLPIEWVIVDDGSTDGTEKIVWDAAKHNSWIHPVQLQERDQRNFGAVVHALQAGIRSLISTEFSYIGLLDADVRFQPDYFEELIQRLDKSPETGLAGGVVLEPGQAADHVPRNREDVPGATQFYTRSCFEDLGDLIAVPEGGWDALTCAQARKSGYKTKLYTDLTLHHLKPRNAALGGVLKRQWGMGIRDYALGYHPLFEFLKCSSRIFDSLPFISSSLWLSGYCCAAIRRRKRVIPGDLLEFVRSEQKTRILNQIFGVGWAKRKQTL